MEKSLRTTEKESSEVPKEAKSEELVRMEGIHKWFGEVHALKGVDFRIDRRETVGLIGDNGAGKSTLIKILAGLIERDRGTVYYKGEEVEIESVRQSQQLGIETVFQEQAIVDPLSVARNIFLGREEVHSFGFGKIMDDRKMREKTEGLLNDLNLDIASPDQEAEFCSGGERQGVAIARAMFFDADVLILDEPMRALSVSGKEKVEDYIEKARDQGTGIIYITHDLHRVYPVADRFVFLSQGEKEMDVRKEECSQEKLRKLYRRREE